jgi:hypothetical protein
MRKALFAVLVAASAFAATPPALFQGGTESKWTLSKGATPAGTVTLLTSAAGTRAEYRAVAKSPVVVLLGGSGKVWMRTTGGDVELASDKSTGPERIVLPALLLPYTISPADKAEAKDGKVSAYSFGASKATYTYDAKGPLEINVTSGGVKYVLKRTSQSTSNADASNFAVRPKSGAGSKLSRLSGDLFGPSDTSVSATAGGRGVSGKGMKLNDGGNYDALLAVETRDEKWSAKMEQALDEFQREGKVGKGGKE